MTKGSIVDIKNIDAEIERVKSNIRELENPDQAIKNLKIELEFLENIRICASKIKMSR